LQRILLPILTLLVVLIIVLIIIAICAHVTIPGFAIDELASSIALVVALLLLAMFINCGSQSCFWVISTRFGTTGAYVAFFVVLGIFIIIAATTRGAAFWILTLFFAALFLFAIPLISPKAYYGFCKQIPFLYGTMLCKAREVRIDPLKTVKIPVTGGISMKIETPSTLYAGEPYEFVFTLTNLYERDISFELKPSMVSSYGSDIEFIQPFKQKTSSLKPKEFYQDSVYLNPDEMTVGNRTCPYSTMQLSVAQNIKAENVTCSHDKPCENDKAACGKLDIFECDCVDWAKATCSKNSLKAKVNIEHSDFFLGNSSLYYSEKITKPAYGFELTQGPLIVITEFLPNPYIAAIHQYRESVSLYVTFRNLGGFIQVRNFKVLPQNTVIHTIDREKQLELIEEVGTQVISCRNINEILPEGLSSGAEVGGKLCDLKPPFVKTTLIDLETNEVKELNDVTYPFLTNYCGKTKPGETGQTYWSTNWDKIYTAVKESGLCEILEKKDSEEKQTVEKALAHVDVIIEFEYDRKMNYYSQEVVPYTRTEKCMELAKSSS